MDYYNRSHRYRNDDNGSSNYERDYDYYRNRDYRGYNNGNRKVYSSDRERDYWNSRNEQMNDYNNYHPYEGNYPRYNDFDNSRRYNENYNNRYRNEGWRDNYRDEDRDWWDKTKDEVSSWFGDDDARRRRRMDEVREGAHRGKGPKNYTRKDERIKEDASDKLSDDSFLDASDIEIEVNGNEITLNGEVDSRYSKHRAEDLVEDVSGVAHVQNNLRVKEPVNYVNSNLNTNTVYSAKSRKDSVTS